MRLRGLILVLSWSAGAVAPAAAQDRDRPWPMLPAFEDSGDAGAPALVEGTARVRAHRATLRRVAPRWLLVTDELELEGEQGPVLLAIPDDESDAAAIAREERLEDEAGRPLSDSELQAALVSLRPGYEIGQWTLREVNAKADGKEARATHRSWHAGDGVLGWEGAWVVPVPAGARRVTISYLLPVVLTIDGAAGSGYRTEGWKTWAAAPAKSTVRFEGLGRQPASHLFVEQHGAVGSWTWEKKTLTWRADGVAGSRIDVIWPGRACRCRAAEPYEACLVDDAWPCLGARSIDPGLERWARQAENGRYDPDSLRLARNWIYAWHGRPFRSQDLRAYFAAQPWYRADAAYADSRLTAADRQAARRIKAQERAP